MSKIILILWLYLFIEYIAENIREEKKKKKVASK